MDHSRILSSLKVPADYNVEEIVEKEFHRTKGQCYLDHAGAALYSEGQVREVMEELSRSLLGNPHSRHGPSDTSTQNLEAARHRILEHFSTTAEEYDLIFTSGATAALRLIAEHFDWNAGQVAPPDNPKANSTSEGDTTELRDKAQQCKRNTKDQDGSQLGAFVYLQENHTSVLGMRGPADEAGCDVYCLTTTDARDLMKEGSVGLSLANDKNSSVNGCKETAVTTSNDPSLQGTKASVNGCGDHARVYQDPSVTTSKCLPGSGPSEPSISPNVVSQDSTHVGTCSHTPQNEEPQGETKRRNCLFAYSAQCNFSGSKAPLEWIRRVQGGALDDLLVTPPMNKQEAPRRNNSTDTRAGCCEGTAWYVVLDAAGLVATCPLDLSRWKPDFVPVSFYKMFGYPTGLGCLLVGRRAWGVLGRTYQGGGTVLMIDSRQMVTVPRPTLHDRFEDGTLPFLSIPAVRHGLDTIHRLTGGIHNIESHVYNLAHYTHHTLRSMRHSRGTPVAQMYLAPGDTWLPHTHGSIVNFNLRNPDGSFVGYAQVERVASLYNIHLRTGCLCNPGACQLFLGITPDKLLGQFKAGHVCGDALDLVDGEPTGSVRVSFGYSSTYQDADLLLRMVRECFVEEPMTFDLTWMKEEVDLSWMTTEGQGKEREEMKNTEEGTDKMEKEGITKVIDKEGRRKGISDNNSNDNDSNKNNNNNEDNSSPEVDNNRNTASPSLPSPSLSSPTTPHPIALSPSSCHPESPGTHRLSDIVLYPIKSCGGVRVGSWGLGEAGLWLDRQWMVVTGAGATVTQKRLPRLALVSPRFDLECGEMVLSFDGEAEELRIPLDPVEPVETSGAALCGGRVCGVRVQGLDCGEAAGDWLSRMLGMEDLRLMMQTSHRPGKLGRGASGTSGESLSLANESQYLVIHRPSVRSLLREINSRGLEELTEDELVQRFRGNLVVDGGEAYEEDSWDTMTINDITLKVQGGCRRCQMVCVVPNSGERTKEPMLSLASARGSSMLFGVHASAPPATEQEERRLCVGATVQVTMK